MYYTFLHEVNDLILDDLAMIDIVVKLDLHLIFHLSILLEELFILYWVSKLLVVFCDQVDLIIVCP